MAEKVTIMVLKVDLQCSCCYKKVKRLLCKFPEIRDQVYDEKQNTVTITVLCCSPEKIRDKLCCKGDKVIKSIEIRSPPRPKEPEKPKLGDKPKEPEKPKLGDKPKEPEKPKGPAEKAKEPEKPRPDGKPQPTPAEKPTPKVPPIVPAAPKAPQVPAPRAVPHEPTAPVLPQPSVPMITGHGCPSIFPYEPCCGPCSQGRPGGPCYNNYYDNSNCGYNNYGKDYNDFNGRPCYARSCDYNYPIGDNTYSSACTIM